MLNRIISNGLQVSYNDDTFGQDRGGWLINTTSSSTAEEIPLEASKEGVFGGCV
jgi:hypothetical protein